MRIIAPITLIGTLLLFQCQQPPKESADLIYPITLTSDTVDTYFGTEVPDPIDGWKMIGQTKQLAG